MVLFPDVAVVLVRHGDTEWSSSGRHTSYTDVPLTERGREQARSLATRLAGIDCTLVLSSPRRRARETAELAGLGHRVDVTDDLAEWDYGEYEGVTTPKIRETDPGWTVWTHAIPGGESAADVAARADKVLDRARREIDNGDVVLVGHGHFSRVLVARWVGLSSTAGVHFGLDPAGIAVLGDERGEPQVEHLNLLPALEG